MNTTVPYISCKVQAGAAFFVAGLLLFSSEIGSVTAWADTGAEGRHGPARADLIQRVVPQTVSVAGTAVDARVLRAIRSASETTGVALPYLLAKAYRESGFDIHADAAASSAAGIFQFTRQTWLELFRRYGKTYGYGELVPVIRRTSRGYLRVPKNDEGRLILNLRHDPVMAAQLAAEYTRENHSMLRRALKRTVSPEELYVAHFMGAQGAVQLLRAVDRNPTALAAKLFPEAAASNSSLFYRYPGRTAISVSSLLRRLVRSFRRELVRFSSSHTGFQMTVLPKHAQAPLSSVPRKPRQVGELPSHRMSPEQLRAAIAQGLMPAGGAALPWIHVMLDGRDPVRARQVEDHHHFHRATILDALEPIPVVKMTLNAPTIAATGWSENNAKIPPRTRDILPPVIAKAALHGAKRTFELITADRIGGEMPSFGSLVARGVMPRYDGAANAVALQNSQDRQDSMVKPGTFSDNTRIEGGEVP